MRKRQRTDSSVVYMKSSQQCQVSEFMLMCPSLREVSRTMLQFRYGEREIKLLVISNICNSLQEIGGTTDTIAKCISMDFPLW